jgi:anaerobic magnesium-protoporphyrin IX monomethyl ester cyclase
LIRENAPDSLQEMKKIVLVNPPYTFWSDEKSYLRPFIGNLPSLGLLTLAAVLRAKGFAVKIIESASLGLSLAQTLEQIRQERPEYLGLSCTTASVLNAARIARAVKALSPTTRVIVGGPHVTALPQETLQRCPDFDLGVLGEGEKVLPDLLHAEGEEGHGGQMPGVVYREGEAVHTTPRSGFVDPLDLLPLPAYDLLPGFPQSYRPPFLNYLKGPAAPVLSSRGCPQRCTFCDRAVFGNRYRYFSAAYLLDWIQHLHRRYGIRHLVFVDDQFTASRARLIEYCEKILQAGIRVSWNCDARVDSVDRGLLSLMKRAGCWMISYGIESGSQKILDGIQKGITLDQVKQTVQATKEAGIRAKGLFMIGYPEETEKTLAETFDLLLRLPLDEANLSFLTPYPGTELYRRIKESSGFQEDWERMNALHPLLQPAALPPGALPKAYGKMVRKFYIRPRTTFSYGNLLVRSPENCTRLAAGLWGLVRQLLL